MGDAKCMSKRAQELLALSKVRDIEATSLYNYGLMRSSFPKENDQPPTYEISHNWRETPEWVAFKKRREQCRR